MLRVNRLRSIIFLLLLASSLSLPLSEARGARRKLCRASATRLLLSRKANLLRPRTTRKEVGWGPGEQMTFSARVGGIEAGRAALSLGKAQPGGREIMVRGRSESLLRSLFSFSEELWTRIDLAHLRPLRSVLKAKRGDRLTETTTDHRHGGISEQRITRRERGKVRQGRRHRLLPTGHLDPFSALLVLRSLPWADRRPVSLHVVSGRKSYGLRVSLAGRGRVRTPGRIADAIQLRGVLSPVTDRGKRRPGKGKRFTLWLSDDRARIPLKAQLESPWGPLALELQTYRASRRPLEVGLPLSLARGAARAP